MARIAYVNGRYRHLRCAVVSIEDRGYQFADGVYEVICLWNGRLLDEEGHLDRLERSLTKLSISQPMRRSALKVVIREVALRNRARNALIYLQITRGVAPRNHAFPSPLPKPSLVVSARAIEPRPPTLYSAGVKAISLPDRRWARCDIKSIALLPNVLAKQAARSLGAHEAWQVCLDGTVSEGASTNVWIVTREGAIVTRPLSHDILGGITRERLMILAKEHQIAIEERPFSLSEAKMAAEAFMTSASLFVVPVVKIDDTTIGAGRPGAVAARLQELYLEAAANAPLIVP